MSIPVVVRIPHPDTDVDGFLLQLAGESPLFVASRKGRTKVVVLLLTHGAIPTPAAVRIARQRGHRDVESALLTANPWAQAPGDAELQ
jgi:hypothetical protein